MSVSDWQAVIGLECHAQLDTRTKLFCSCALPEWEAEPNTAICPVCTGHPGTLPVLNEAAVRLGTMAGLATSCTVNDGSIFARKQYFYPDLPKGYQISQFDQPLCTDGHVDVDVDGTRHTFRIHRIHLEEDAGKSFHTDEGTFVDFNRAGTPLAEIVSEADMRTAEQAEAYLRMLHRVLVEAGITTGDLEKGHFRCDANVSVHRPGAPWGTRTEIKNLNSFRFVAKAIRYEIARQIEVIEDGGTIERETRTWRDGRTLPMRGKEGSSDYRYFPEPDLRPVRVPEAVREAAVAALPGVPMDRWLLDQDAAERNAFRARFALDDAVTEVLLARDDVRRFFEETVRAGGDPVTMANWVQTEVLRGLNEGLDLDSLDPAALPAIQAVIDKGTILHGNGKRVLDVVWREGGDPVAVIDRLGLATVDDSDAIRRVAREAVQENPEQVARYRDGNKRMIGFFMGQVMRAMKGRADPATTNRILVEELENLD